MVEPLVDGISVPELTGQVPPRGPGAVVPQDCLYRESLIMGVSAWVAAFVWEQGFDASPLAIGEHLPCHVAQYISAAYR